MSTKLKDNLKNCGSRLAAIFVFFSCSLQDLVGVVISSLIGYFGWHLFSGDGFLWKALGVLLMFAFLGALQSLLGIIFNLIILIMVLIDPDSIR